MTQALLFGDAPLAASIEGLVYAPDFLSLPEEQALIQVVQTLPLHAAQYKQYVARRRVLSFGGSYDFAAHRLLPGIALDVRLRGLRGRVAAWLGVSTEALAHVLVAEYTPGTPLGWHRDVPDFETVAGVSLGSHAVLRFRPDPDTPSTRKVVELHVAPRSIYLLAGDARWRWQHCVAPTAAVRWS